MTRRFLVLFSFLFVFALRCNAQRIDNDDRLRNVVRQYGQAEVIIPYTNRKVLDNLTRYVSILSVKNGTVFISLSSLSIEWFILQKFNYLITEKTDVKGVISALDVNQAMEWDTYPTYTQYESIMQSFATLYPDLCHLETIGTSVNGKLVLVLKISDNVVTNEDEPEVFYSSTIHGDETGGFIMMLRLADYLLKNYNLSSRVKNLVDNIEIWINPLANPDGTYRTGNTISSPTRYNANGYDLNRNFPDPLNTSIIPQKENVGMMKFMCKHKFVLSANFHAGEEVVNYPWDRWYPYEKLHADNDWFYNISRKYADTVHIHSVPGYMTFKDNGVTNGADWYKIEGGRQDYVTYELQGREVTIELDNNFITPAIQLNSLWESNWRSLLGYLENALYGVHGHVKDVLSGDPIQARVYIEGHDKDSSHVYSDTLTGSFFRLLSPGIWDLHFTAGGYINTFVSDVVVTAGEKTDLLVRMQPNVPDYPLLFPNPANGYLKVILSERLSGRVNIKIFNPTGIKIMDFYSDFTGGFPLIIDVKSLAAGVYTIQFMNTISKVSEKGRFIVVRN